MTPLSLQSFRSELTKLAGGQPGPWDDIAVGLASAAPTTLLPGAGAAITSAAAGGLAPEGQKARAIAGSLTGMSIGSPLGGAAAIGLGLIPGIRAGTVDSSPKYLRENWKSLLGRHGGRYLLGSALLGGLGGGLGYHLATKDSE